jgi:phage terminase small subunit
MNQPRTLAPQQKEFARFFLLKLAHGYARGRAAAEAAKAAGYTGTSIAHNARRLAQDRRIKAYMAELANPSPPPEIKAAEAKVTATVEMAKEELSKILLAEIDLDTVKPSDKINAVKQLALIEGWNVTEKHEHERPLKHSVSPYPIKCNCSPTR